MGCVSSKIKHRDIIVNSSGSDYVNHVVSLTSTTYGALKLDFNESRQPWRHEEEEKQVPIKEIVVESKKSVSFEEPEVINTWELMKDLEDGVTKKSPKSKDARSPLKFLNRIGSPKKAKTFAGKENKVRKLSDFSPRPRKSVMRLSYPIRDPPMKMKMKNSETISGDNSENSGRFSPLFDPELVALYERELSEEEEQIKKIISLTPKLHQHQNLKSFSIKFESIFSCFERKCVPGGENSVVFYTTTLRGIRKTFEDCNKVRAIIESHNVHALERDISMDLRLREELRMLRGTKEVKVPLVFIRGRLIGGADEVVKLEEEGKLGILFDGIPARVAGGCGGCGGVRFVMCGECNGSCKVLDEEEKKMVKCGECNENGLIQCPICC